MNENNPDQQNLDVTKLTKLDFTKLNIPPLTQNKYVLESCFPCLFDTNLDTENKRKEFKSNLLYGFVKSVRLAFEPDMIKVSDILKIEKNCKSFRFPTPINKIINIMCFRVVFNEIDDKSIINWKLNRISNPDNLIICSLFKEWYTNGEISVNTKIKILRSDNN